MSDRPEVELSRDEFRHIPDGPLGKPKDLNFAIAVWGAGALLSAYGGWQIGGYFGSLLPIIPAIWLGASLAGRYPRWFFGKAE